MYKVSDLTNTSRPGRPELIDWANTKKRAFDIIKKETGLTPTIAYSTFCKKLQEARKEGKRSIVVWVGLALIHKVQVEIQL